MSLLAKLKSPYPYYLNDDRKNTFLALCIGLFVVFFLHVYKPQNNYDIILTFGQKVMFGGVAFAVLFFNIVLLPKFLHVAAIDPVNWNVQKYILHILWICFMIAIVNIAIDRFYVCPQKPLDEIIVHVFTQVAFTGIIPIAIMSLLFRNNLLQQNLQSAITANQELQKIKDLKNEAPKNNNYITIYSDTSETLNFNLPDLLFVEADDNYSTVVWKNGEGVQRKLLRANLKSIENQIDNSFTLRCHRSYLVNINAIGSISGNTNGYRLRFTDTDFTIPVARQKGKEVMEKIKQFRNVMELS